MTQPFALALLLSAAPATPDAPYVAALEHRLAAATRSAEDWRARRGEVRTQILAAAGLYPEFERPPVKAVVFGKVEGDGYTIERVHLETLPGFHLTGSLYRPRGKRGPFPGILSPHGHWREGRYTQQADGNLPARGITFARLGFVCFMYDMVGFGDFMQVPHEFDDPAWGMGLLGLQTWNSLRAVDFVASLPDVDPERLGATGASGGGTQTFLLTAIDDRIKVAAPVNMVAAEFQGGCSCENAPFLRLGLNNVEIAAMTAPRPLLLVAATGDWTAHVPALEARVLKRVFDELGVPDRFRAVQFDAPHNYNQASREAVYAWMVRWLQNGPVQDRIPEPPVPVVARDELVVWSAEHPLPEGSVDAAGLKDLLRAKVRAQIDALYRSAPERQRLRPQFQEALRVSMGVPSAFSRRDPGEIDLWVSHGGTPTKGPAILVAGPTFDPQSPLVARFLETGHRVYGIGLRPHPRETPAGGDLEQLGKFTTTFYRSALAWQVDDLLAAFARISSDRDVTSIDLVATGEAGVPMLIANAIPMPRPPTGRLVADLGGIGDDEQAWTGALEHPAMLRLGGLRTMLLLGQARHWVLHDSQGRFEAAPVRKALGLADDDAMIEVRSEALSVEELRDLLSR